MKREIEILLFCYDSFSFQTFERICNLEHFKEALALEWLESLLNNSAQDLKHSAKNTLNRLAQFSLIINSAKN